MLKPVIVATAALAIAGTSLVYAQQRGDHHRFGGPGAEQHHRPSAADMAAFTDARIVTVWSSVIVMSMAWLIEA